MNIRLGGYCGYYDYSDYYESHDYYQDDSDYSAYGLQAHSSSVVEGKQTHKEPPASFEALTRVPTSWLHRV